MSMYQVLKQHAMKAAQGDTAWWEGLEVDSEEPCIRESSGGNSWLIRTTSDLAGGDLRAD